ncbi:MAG: response regulator [Chloroflexi bacterium]|nr:response regulator [Chloroflexota bacterium]
MSVTLPPARLLLADDEENVLLTLGEILRHEGYDVVPASTAAEARDLVSGQDFDLIVTDMHMEEEASGLSILAAARERDPHAMGIILTGYASFPSAVEALQAGVSDYLAKPSNIEQLKAAVAKALEKRQLGRVLIQAERAEAGRVAAERALEEAEAARSQAQRYLYEQTRALEAVERHAARLALLSTAGVELSDSMDMNEALHRLAELAVPVMADWCVVDVLNPHDHLIQDVAVAHVDPHKVQLAREAQRLAHVLNSPRGHALQQVLATGKTYHQPHVSQDGVGASVSDPRALEILRVLHPRSILTVPLVAEDRVLGVMSFLFSESERVHDAEDVSVCEDLGRRAGVAIEHRRLLQDLQQQRDRMADFLGAAAHDLRTPLTAVKGWVQIMERDIAQLKGARAERLKHGAEAVNEAATRMSKLMSELLDVAGLDAGQQLQLNLGSVDLVQMVRRLVAEHEQVDQGRHTISLACAGDELAIEGDEPRLERVFTNLLSNALKYSAHDTEVRLSVGVERVGDADWAAVSVRDTGMGIPHSQLERVFERFQRGDNVRERIAGTGIGLTYVREVVLLHGGSVSVESQENAGSVFTVRLPLALSS